MEKKISRVRLHLPSQGDVKEAESCLSEALLTADLCVFPHLSRRAVCARCTCTGGARLCDFFFFFWLRRGSEGSVAALREYAARPSHGQPSASKLGARDRALVGWHLKSADIVLPDDCCLCTCLRQRVCVCVLPAICSSRKERGKKRQYRPCCQCRW